VFTPNEEKLSFREYMALSIAVRIPTNAMIPKEMTRSVKIARNRLPRMARNANRTFSPKSIMVRSIYFFKKPKITPRRI
jgi:predicted XRE-type DNA-binding protein